MAKKKVQTINGPDGTEYPVHVLHPQIVKGDALVKDVIHLADKLSELTQHYYNVITNMVVGYLDDTAAEYDEKWQGNTVLKTYDGKMAVEVDVQMQKSYDERLQIASEKIRSWLDSKLDAVTDPSARKVFEQVSLIAKTALRIDHKGSVDQKKLLQLRKFDFAGESEWQEAMELISASERVTGSKRYIRFKKANEETGKLEAILVDFSRF